MTTVEHPTPAPSVLDPAEIEAFTGLVAGHATLAINACLVSLGDQLGLWKAMAGAGPFPSPSSPSERG